VTELGRRLSESTDDSRETAFLFQRLSVAIQRFNSVLIQETLLLLLFFVVFIIIIIVIIIIYFNAFGSKKPKG